MRQRAELSAGAALMACAYNLLLCAAAAASRPGAVAGDESERKGCGRQ
ncbi:hypothetical protein PF003_g34007 [Phytophthora fragariae]|nr:hypothetical protein PF003_g34007 [Phytophthora fragariae]